MLLELFRAATTQLYSNQQQGHVARKYIGLHGEKIVYTDLSELGLDWKFERNAT